MFQSWEVGKRAEVVERLGRILYFIEGTIELTVRRKGREGKGEVKVDAVLSGQQERQIVMAAIKQMNKGMLLRFR